MYQTLNLSHADAQQMVDAVRRRVEADHKGAAIAVTDSHGELIAFLKMDGCHLPPVQIAVNKAFTAARERRASGAVGESSRNHPFPMTNYGDLRYTGWAGGMPVIVDGQVVGAIGISGLDEKAEAELGQMAVELVTRAAKGG
ncbi:MAG TPA: heme-binding protein [Spirochaetia bacterium]|nr:heme-binding protein [Spirochaetia bacterium]